MPTKRRDNPNGDNPKTCATAGCDRPLVSHHGNARFCMLHGARTNRAKDLRRAAAQGDELAADDLARIGRAPPEASNARSQLERYSVMLGQAQGDAVAAAELAGLSLRGDALDAYALEARQTCPDLVEGKQTAATSLANAALLLLLIRVRDSIPLLPSTSLAPALRQLGETIDRLQGGLAPVYSQVAVQIRLAAEAQSSSPIIDVGGGDDAPTRH